jgi:GT2 family glycosyltransferase
MFQIIRYGLEIPPNLLERFSVKTIAILITCHNRKETTVQCLRTLFACEIPPDIDLHVYLVDDGSTDGTYEAIKEQFPQVNLIKGDGNLFWNRGMHLAWQTASNNKDYDFYLWLNDDTILRPNALEVLLSTSQQFSHTAIIVGSTSSVHYEKQFTYGGRDNGGKLIIPEQIPLVCSYFNGNIVFIPNFVYKNVGMNDPIFRHALGDFDYGMRAKNFGINSYIAPGIVGKCDKHVNLPLWCNPKIGFSRRWNNFRTPLGNNPEEFFVFEKRHRGILIAIFHYITNHLRVLFPYLWGVF